MKLKIKKKFFLEKLKLSKTEIKDERHDIEEK